MPTLLVLEMKWASSFKKMMTMKKLILFAIAAVFAMVSCNKEKVEPNQEPIQITFNLTANHPNDADATKAVKTGWVDNDVIFVFFSGATAPMYLEMKREGGSWVFDSKNELALVNGSTGTMRAVYLPFGSDVTVNNDGSNYTFSRTDYTYYLTATLDYTVVDGVVSGTFNMSWPDGFVQFSMPVNDGEDDGVTFFRTNVAGQYTLAEDHLIPTGIASIAADGTITETDDKSLGDPMVGYYYDGPAAYDECILFSGVLADAARKDKGAADNIQYNFTFVNNMGTGYTYDDVTYYLSGKKNLYTDATHNRALLFPIISSPRWTVEEPGYVIVSGVKWAKWNVGATTEEGYGDYFAWGAIYPQYKYEDSDYNESAISTDLTTAQDVAYQKLGSNWHMPTDAQLTLLKNRISEGTWVNNYKSSGVNGYLITADNGTDTLFLPAAGWWGDVLSVTAGTDGNYWPSTYFDDEFAPYLYFLEDVAQVSGCERYDGFSVRPVHN